MAQKHHELFLDPIFVAFFWEKGAIVALLYVNFMILSKENKTHEGKAEYFKLTLQYQVNFSIEIIKAISCGN